MNTTKIEWADLTSNPIAWELAGGKRVWHCTKVSAGCANCYAERLNKRFNGVSFAQQAGDVFTVKPVLRENELQAILHSRVKPGSRVFVADMTDLFHPDIPFEMIAAVYGVMSARPDLIFMILTKRPQRAKEFDQWVRETAWPRVFPNGLPDCPADANAVLQYVNPSIVDVPACGNVEPEPWPLPNVWLGTSVEDQQAADERIPRLLATPAVKRFISYEPALGPIDLGYNSLGITCPECDGTGDIDDPNHPMHPSQTGDREDETW